MPDRARTQNGPRYPTKSRRGRNYREDTIPVKDLTNTSRPSELLADPAQVAVIRELIVHARKVGAQHAIYSVGNGVGQAMAPREHTWDLGSSRVGYHAGALYFDDERGKTVLSGAGFDDARQVADILVALDILPARFSSLAATMRRLADELECEGSTDQLDSAFRIRQTLDGEYEPTGDPR